MDNVKNYLFKLNKNIQKAKELSYFDSDSINIKFWEDGEITITIDNGEFRGYDLEKILIEAINFFEYENFKKEVEE